MKLKTFTSSAQAGFLKVHCIFPRKERTSDLVCLFGLTEPQPLVLPPAASAEGGATRGSLITGEVRVMVTVMCGSLAPITTRAASSGLHFTLYLSSGATICNNTKLQQDQGSETKVRD